MFCPSWKRAKVAMSLAYICIAVTSINTEVVCFILHALLRPLCLSKVDRNKKYTYNRVMFLDP